MPTLGLNGCQRGCENPLTALARTSVLVKDSPESRRISSVFTENKIFIYIHLVVKMGLPQVLSCLRLSKFWLCSLEMDSFLPTRERNNGVCIAVVNVTLFSFTHSFIHSFIPPLIEYLLSVYHMPMASDDATVHIVFRTVPGTLLTH